MFLIITYYYASYKHTVIAWYKIRDSAEFRNYFAIPWFPSFVAHHNSIYECILQIYSIGSCTSCYVQQALFSTLCWIESSVSQASLARQWVHQQPEPSSENNLWQLLELPVAFCQLSLSCLSQGLKRQHEKFKYFSPMISWDNECHSSDKTIWCSDLIGGSLQILRIITTFNISSLVTVWLFPNSRGNKAAANLPLRHLQTCIFA